LILCGATRNPSPISIYPAREQQALALERVAAGSREGQMQEQVGIGGGGACLFRNRMHVLQTGG
jgi:hypothetical protein